MKVWDSRCIFCFGNKIAILVGFGGSSGMASQITFSLPTCHLKTTLVAVLLRHGLKAICSTNEHFLPVFSFQIAAPLAGLLQLLLPHGIAPMPGRPTPTVPSHSRKWKPQSAFVMSFATASLSKEKTIWNSVGPKNNLFMRHVFLLPFMEHPAKEKHRITFKQLGDWGVLQRKTNSSLH